MLGKSPIKWRQFPDHCLLVPFYTHTNEIRILCGHTHISLGCVYARPFMGMEFPRTYAQQKYSATLVRICALSGVSAYRYMSTDT